jgi:dolichol-phosphate mannosyltransferase
MTGETIGDQPPAPQVPRVSVVLATINERLNLPEVIERVLRQPLPPTEIIVVDDGSTDGTREYVEELAARDPRIRLILHGGKQTTLRAQCQGIEAAAGSFVVVMDADLQHPPEILAEMIARLEDGAALVVASRYAPGGSAGRRTVVRWVVSRGAEGLAKLLLPPARGVSDPVSGYFAFRRGVWVPLNPLYRGYKLLIFLLMMAEGQRVSEVGFRFTPRSGGASKVTESSAFVRLFLVELLLARRLRTQPRVGPPVASADAGSSHPTRGSLP